MSAWQSIDEEALREMRGTGLTVPAIAEMLGVPPRHVEYRCAELGIRSSRPTHSWSGGSGESWEISAAQGSMRLLRAIRKAHPEKVVAA